MKKTNLINVIFSVVMILLITAFINLNTVYAADGNNISTIDDITNTLSTENSSSNTSNTTNSSNTSNTNSNTNRSNTNATNTNTRNNIVNTNTNLPKTGAEDVIPVAMLIVVFGISSIYAYKKISEYKDI